MKDLVNKLIKKPFLRNVAILASGTAAAQAVGLLSSPIITRLYGPEAFGLMGVFMAIVQIFIPIAALTYPIAIVLPKDDRNAKKVMQLSLYITFGFAVLISILLIFFNDLLVQLFNIQEVSSYLFLIPIVILLAGLMQVSNQWLIRTKQFGINAKAAFLQSLIINSGKIGVGIYYPTALILIIFNTLANGVRTFIMLILIKRTKYEERRSDEEEQLSIKKLAKRHRDFPMYRAPEVLINAVSQRFPVLLLTSFFGPAAAGFYTLGNTVLQQPIRLISESVGNVFYPRITEAAHNKESLTRLITKATISLGGVGIFPFGAIIIFGPWLFSLVFGGDWVMAGKYAQWVGLFLFFEFINKPSVRSLPVLSAQRFHLIFTVVTLIVRISALAIGYFIFSSDLVAIALFGISSAIMHILLILFVLSRSKKFDEDMAK